MFDNQKLTVAKLHDELTRRGLSKGGLKAVLVQRLIEDDEHSMDVVDPRPNDNTDELGTEPDDNSSNRRPSSSRSSSSVP